MERRGEGRESYGGVQTGSDARHLHARAAHPAGVDNGGKTLAITLSTGVLRAYEGRTYTEDTCVLVSACLHCTGLNRLGGACLVS